MAVTAKGGAGGRLVGVETGGTKILCRVIDKSGATLADVRFDTTTPDAALAQLTVCIEGAGGPVAGIGIASFGPVVVDPASSDYGRVLATPKSGWEGANLWAALTERFDAPAALDTDVNCAALAEAADGAAIGLSTVAYLTVGTGIGGGLVTGGRLLHGALHPEVGHLRLHRALGDDAPSGCPFHDDCAEGLCAGPALAGRLAGGGLADDPRQAALVAGYLAELCAALTLAWSPECIVLGGGVMKTLGLLSAVEAALQAAAGSYGPLQAAVQPGFLRPAALENAGLTGALMLAKAAAATSRPAPVWAAP
ncbi:ROK family protein [soil metagenome]